MAKNFTAAGVKSSLAHTVLCLQALSLSAVAAVPPEAESRSWSVAGGEIVIELNQGVLSPLGIEADAINALAETRPKHPLGYRKLRFEGLSLQKIRFSAPAGAVEEFFGGYLQYHGGLLLDIGDSVIDLTDFRISPHPGHPGLFRLLDRRGMSWATLDHGHYQLVDEGASLELRHANLSLSTELAERIGKPGQSGQLLGVAHLRAPVVSATTAASSTGTPGCALESANWPASPQFNADVALIGMNVSGGYNPVHFLRCMDCDGTGGGPVVIAPNAELRNVGSADVPWWEQFTPPRPPYGNDQHPFLVWNLYRMDRHGRFEQIGVSGVKHAFFTVNANCPCPGGNILWTGCEDVYSAGNNDLDTFLAPRDEIVPASGRWGRCDSLFDPDCDADQEGSSTNPFENRLRVMESDLAPSANPDARYFMEAWYVVRDDVDIFNTMGWREISPAWNGSTWEFPVAGDFNAGPALSAWVDPADPNAGESSALLVTDDGRVRVSVVVGELGGGNWRYDYVVMNHDFMRAATAGSEPDLQILSNTGLNAVELPRVPGTNVSSIEFARANRSTGQDWSTLSSGTAIRWQNPGDTPLDWGTGFRFSVVADRPPGPVTFRLYPEAAGAALGVATLGPELPEPLFGDGFEAPASP